VTIADWSPIPGPLRGAILSIGNFDGVHRGHGQLMRRLRAVADAHGVPALALTFDPHPVAMLRPEAAPVPLTWPGRTIELLREAGATDVGVFRAGPWLLGLTARDFYDRVIHGLFAARGLVEGPTFGFGRDRAGNVERLGAWCREDGLTFEVAEPVQLEGGIVSSSRIRSLLTEGRVGEAAHLLGRSHRLRGHVVRGVGRGAGLGFPTANLHGIDTQVPDDGVYVAVARLDDGSSLPTALHIGRNATFGAEARTVEAHLLDFEGDLYGRFLELDLIDRLRGSRAFDGVPALLAQVREDIAAVRGRFDHSGPSGPVVASPVRPRLG
jgi:riboflavin kinase/FMN adenylyltransferase